MLDTFATGVIDLTFINGRSAQAVSLSAQHTSDQALALMGLLEPQPTLVIIGGASLMSPDSLERLQTVFDQVLAPLAQELHLAVLDGGTDAGVIHMMGKARGRVGGDFPLIGVVPQGKAQLPNDDVEDNSRHALEPNHTNFFLIPGDDWGSESPWLAELASQLSNGQPTLTILINGGKVAFTDLQANLAMGRPAVVLGGSGRLADIIAAAAGSTPHPETSPDVIDVLHTYQPSGQLTVLNLAMPLGQLRDRIKPYFDPAP
ncbi:MAG: hypothetical protein ACFCVD_13520 [Nodosilinea sp.]